MIQVLKEFLNKDIKSK
ncbi:hypothetical protein MOE91_21930 [Bacillus inaquosorum]|nr:hypothetical protein [Bacillus inaquosorum]